MKCLALVLVPMLSAGAPLLVQKPTANRTHIVFSLAGDLWEVPRQGGEARRLTAGVGTETQPIFSPDGSNIAFTGEYDGNVDVYVMPAAGGVPKRLTWHPAEDVAVAWTPDSSAVLFRSSRESETRHKRLFKVPAKGGPAEVLPLPMGAHGSYSPDGERLAYLPIGFQRPLHRYDSWRRYRGGQAPEVWIANLHDSSITKVPRTDSNDTLPMWIGSRVYFLSDRSGYNALWFYDVATKKVELAWNPGRGTAELKWASAGPDVIALEQFGQISLFDPKTKKVTPVDIRVTADLLEVRPRMERLSGMMRWFAISPTGARALFGARGEVITVPAEKGDARNITATSNAYERSPTWSPDGKWIAYWSDASGEYELHLRKPDGLGEVRRIPLAEPGFYFEPVWSPDSKKIAFADNRLNLWMLEIESGKPTKVDTDHYYDPLGLQRLDPQWSPDSRWIAYARLLKNHQRAIFTYSLASGKGSQITDGMSDARSPVWDKDGKHLYFTASTDMALKPAWLDMSSNTQHSTRSVYVAVLRKDLPSPLGPESDEEHPAGEKKTDDKSGNGIDFDGISQRILALPMPPRNYDVLAPGKSGVLYIQEITEGDVSTVHKFDLKKRKPETFLTGVNRMLVSADGEKCLYQQGERFAIAATANPPKPGEGTLKTADLEVRVDPRAEWRQMFQEVWRIQRDWFYDPKYHGYNLKAAADKYAVYLEGLGSRGDLSYLFEEMLSDMTVGHLYISGGQFPNTKKVNVGLLGASFEVYNGRYRFQRVLSGENWNPNLRAPLTGPGVNVEEGDYLLAVDGVDVQIDREPYAYFEGLANKQVTIRVGRDPNGAGSREVVVVPVADETALRLRSWIDGNRKYVDYRSKGRVAYVYLPDTGSNGYQYFNRYFFAQTDKDAAIIDERFNGGGQAADFIVDYLRRPLLNYWTTRYGADFATPQQAIHGPKVMIVNEPAGSGGDALPWYFRKLHIGPLIGKRTWGGLVGILGFPVLMDGGTVTAPNMAFWNPQGPNGKPVWDVENHGVAPDIEVDLDPKEWRQGRDAQLERAIDTVMGLLDKQPKSSPRHPDFPDYNSPSAAGGSK